MINLSTLKRKLKNERIASSIAGQELQQEYKKLSKVKLDISTIYQKVKEVELTLSAIDKSEHNDVGTLIQPELIMSSDMYYQQNITLKKKLNRKAQKLAIECNDLEMKLKHLIAKRNVIDASYDETQSQYKKYKTQQEMKVLGDMINAKRTMQ